MRCTSKFYLVLDVARLLLWSVILGLAVVYLAIYNLHTAAFILITFAWLYYLGSMVLSLSVWKRFRSRKSDWIRASGILVSGTKAQDLEDESPPQHIDLTLWIQSYIYSETIQQCEKAADIDQV